MMSLSDGERISMIRSAVLIQYTRVTDGQTGGIGVAYMLSRVKTVSAKRRIAQNVTQLDELQAAGPLQQRMPDDHTC